MSTSQFPRLADASDIGRLISRDRVHDTWPPPGTTVLPIAAPEAWVVVEGEPTSGRDGDWWVTDLATIAGLMNTTAEQLLLLLAKTWVGPIATFAGTVGRWPVIYTQGEGRSVRWIASTLRGTLAGIETFQFGLNWGSPGSDPDPNQSEVAAFATELAGIVAAELVVAGASGATPLGTITSDVKFTEVGATKKLQSQPTNADGSGGDLSQPFDTEWHAYPTATQPTGGVGNSLPFEVACALTLQTDARGASGRGRVYIPPFATGGMVAAGRFNANYAAAWAEFVGRVADEVSTSKGWDLIVVSRRKVQLHTVEQILVGTVPDSQRRRRRNQDEARLVKWART